MSSIIQAQTLDYDVLNMDVSIVVINWNTREILRECLSSITEQTQGIKYEVIVVDNASTDGSAEMVKDDYPEVVLVENSENRGFAAANNQAILMAKGRYVLLINSDTIVLDNAIEKVVDFAEEHPKSAVVGCRALNSDRSLQLTCFKHPSILNMILSSTYLYKIFPKNKFFGRERMTWWDRNSAREVDVVTGCFMLLREKAIKQVGLMDERFFMYGEETDWCYRFKNHGWKVMFTPCAEIVHLGGQSSKKIITEMSLQLHGSILQFIHKHRPRWEYVLACLLVWLFCAVRIIFWFACFLFSRQDRNYKLGRMEIYAIATWRIIKGGYKTLCIHDKR
jgi:GT2 family glycosyltransferase